MSHSPQLVLLPGLAADERMWRGVLPLLPAALRPEVATAHQDVNLHRIEDFAARLLAQHAGPLVLAGASMGGMIAMEAARQAPQRVAGIALLGTTARPETPDVRALRDIARFMHDPTEGVTLTSDNEAGRSSMAVTAVAVEGPRFLMDTVHVI